MNINCFGIRELNMACRDGVCTNNVANVFFSLASRAVVAQHVAPPPGIVEIDSEKFACQW